MKWYEVLSLFFGVLAMCFSFWAIRLAIRTERIVFGELPTVNRADFDDDENRKMAEHGDSRRSPYIIEPDDEEGPTYE